MKTNFRTEYSEVGGDEEFPLGQEFQDHLRCFIDPKEKTPVGKFRLAEKLIQQMA